MNILNSILRKFKSKETSLDNNESITLNYNPINNITFISDFLQFDTAKNAWSSLLNKLTYKSVFLSHDWFNTSWIWNEPTGSPNIILIYKDQALVAIFPLVIESNKNKNVFKLISSPLTPFNDAIINPEYADYAINTLFEILSAWSKYWDRLELTNLPVHSTLLKKIWHQKRNKLPFKYKIKAMAPVSYVKLYEEDKATIWDAWVNNQPSATKKVLLKNNAAYAAINPTDSQSPSHHSASLDGGNNILEIQKTNIDNQNQLSKSLLEYIDAQQIVNLNKMNRSRITLSFVKRFAYYNKKNNWLMHFDWLKNQTKLFTQYTISDNSNYYYLSTAPFLNKSEKNLARTEELILQSTVFKSCFMDKIKKFYFTHSSTLSRNWKIEKENRFQIIIYNKSKKWF